MKTNQELQTTINEQRIIIDKLKRSNYKYKERLNKYKFNKKHENLKHELRRSCKDNKYKTLEDYQNYIYGLTLK